MTDIEQRAYKHYPIDLQKSNDMEMQLKNDAGWDGYVLGATEQKAIDIEKMVEWLICNADDYIQPNFEGERGFEIQMCTDLRKVLENED